MNESTCTDAQQILLAFAQRCFIGTQATVPVSTDDHAWVRDYMQQAEALTPGDVAMWPSAKQNALRGMLNDCIIFLELQRRSNGDRMPPDTLLGSSADQLAQPLLSGVVAAQESLHA